jgi:acyl-CoA thioester hydrolase
MYISSTQIRVRYAETDQMGYVYYGNYPTYYEVGRTEALRQLGTTYQQLESLGVAMPVASMSLKYIKPAKYDDLLTIKTIVKETPHMRMHFQYEVFNQEGVLLNIGESVLAFISIEKGKPIVCPDYLIELFTKALNEQGAD